MILVFTVFITINNLGGKWRGLLSSPKVPRKQTFKLLKKQQHENVVDLYIYIAVAQ